jgi:hypothetical protein
MKAMDGSLTALIAASFGLVGTALGSTVTAWTTRANANKSADSARRQVYDKATADHAHWMRQQRLAAFDAFLEAWDECLRITQASGSTEAADETSLDELRAASGRMAERARRIALLGPEGVTRAAEELAATMQEDVEISARFIKAVRATMSELDDRPVSVDAMGAASGKFQQSARQVVDLMRATVDQGGDLRDLDGHPLLNETIDSGEKYIQASTEAREAMEDSLERLSAIVGEATAMVAVLKRNKGVRELSRERFTESARRALSTPMLEQ